MSKLISRIRELREQKTLLTAIENKFLFVVSRYFWHIITSLATLALALGVLWFLYTITPVFKDSPKKESYPEKEAYPEKENVSKEELLSALAPKSKTQPKKQAAQQQYSGTKEPAEVEEIPEAYSTALAALAEIVPEVNTTQCAEYEYSYWSGNTCIRYEKINRAENTFAKLKIDDYNKRTQLITEYINIVSNHEKKNRLASLNAVLNMGTKDLSRYTADLSALRKTDSVFKQNIKLLQKSATLLAKNPNDGKPLLQYIILSAPSFSDSVQQDFASFMVDSYSKTFGKLERQKEYTDAFLPMAKEFEAFQQVPALKKYYELQADKNKSRDKKIEEIDKAAEQKIREIDEKYASASINAEREYESKKSAKSEMRKTAAIVIGGAIVVIAIFALVLVILSIQRNVVKLLERQEKLEENLK